MITIESAYNAYMNGLLDPWDLQEVVESFGFKGWTIASNGRLTLHR